MPRSGKRSDLILSGGWPLLVERLREEWRARGAAEQFHAGLCFRGDELVLGAGTVLAKARIGPGPVWSDDDEARVAALLSAALGWPIGRQALDHVKAAAGHWRTGDKGLAALHLALSRVGRLDPPAEAARRLFMADGLMRAGVTPETLLNALSLDPRSGAATLKYNPDQPRVPAGSGRPSGQWTSGDGGSAKPAQGQSARGPAARRAQGRASQSRMPEPARTPAPRTGPAPIEAGAGEAAGLDLGALSAATLSRLGSMVLTASEAAGGPALALGFLLIPSTGPKGQWVKVGGPGDISYFRQPDEVGLRFKFTAADGRERTFESGPGPDGGFLGPDGQVVARWAKVDGKVVLLVYTAAFVGYEKAEPNACPAPTKDQPGARERNLNYEDYIKAMVNPGNPTPRGMAYKFLNPSTGAYVNIDDCQLNTGVLVEIKGPGFFGKIRRDGQPGLGMENGMLDQALSQVQAAGNRPLIWVFEEKDVANYMREKFKKEKDGRSKIIVMDMPWK